MREHTVKGAVHLLVQLLVLDVKNNIGLRRLVVGKLKGDHREGA